MEKVIKVLKINTNKMIKACTKSDTSRNYIIVIDGVCVSPDSSTRKGVRNGLPCVVERFHKTEATLLAQKCSNANGVRGVARYWRAETEDHIMENERVIETLERNL